MSMVLTTPKALVVPGLLLAVGVGVVGQRLVTDSHPSTRVLGEKTVIQGSGQSSAGSTAAKPSGGGTTTNNANPNNNGNGTASGAGNKTFSISGEAAGLYPGGTVQLELHVTNALNQDMTVNSLGASLLSVSPTTCIPGLTIDAWTGEPFTLLRNTTDFTAPGTVPVTMAETANDDCQGATITLKYTGTAVQK